eukprot:TRINITY_DN1606_c0_g1_i3.p1 TRINITY_DN1606_c0_g1~~TRINITY_DN1606_c0_g1_i3.p1  ORF type:complete len:258 (-),score=65.21 TRINITY_DN1606_c0_g1_i3:362-1135(-)
MTVLYARLQGVDFNGAQLNARNVQEHLTGFMLTVTREVKAANGTMVQCSGDVAVAMWPSRSPQSALICASAIQSKFKRPVTQVIQCGQFLTGSLGDERTRSFNVVGPLYTLSQQLVALGSTQRSDILITDQEKETAMYDFNCLPYQRVWVEGTAQTVYAMVLSPKGTVQEEDEWIYRMQTTIHGCALGKLSDLWDAYSAGDYRAARLLVDRIAGDEVPPWYPDHIKTLLDEAEGHDASPPIKYLQSSGWTFQAPRSS